MLFRSRLPAVPPNRALEGFLSKWRFSEYQKNELKRLWGRIESLQLCDKIQVRPLPVFRSGGEFLNYLQKTIDKNPVHLEPLSL